MPGCITNPVGITGIAKPDAAAAWLGVFFSIFFAAFTGFVGVPAASSFGFFVTGITSPAGVPLRLCCDLVAGVTDWVDMGTGVVAIGVCAAAEDSSSSSESHFNNDASFCMGSIVEDDQYHFFGC